MAAEEDPKKLSPDLGEGLQAMQDIARQQAKADESLADAVKPLANAAAKAFLQQSLADRPKPKPGSLGAFYEYVRGGIPRKLPDRKQRPTTPDEASMEPDRELSESERWLYGGLGGGAFCTILGVGLFGFYEQYDGLGTIFTVIGLFGIVAMALLLKGHRLTVIHAAIAALISTWLFLGYVAWGLSQKVAEIRPPTDSEIVAYIKTHPQQGFGFQEATQPPPTHPSKVYSDAEKRKLLDLMGQISTQLNEQGLRSARTAQSLGTLPQASNDRLEDTVQQGQKVIAALNVLNNKIWNDIVPDNPGFASDLGYVLDSKTKFDQFQHATDVFLGQIINFQRNFSAFNQNQINWIAGLIQQGGGEVWGRTGQDFEAWINQATARIDKEREGLK